MRQLIRKFLQKFNYDIVKLHPVFKIGAVNKDALESEFRWLKEYQFKTIIDVGANEGQFSEKMRILFPDAFIYAFEPLEATFKILQKNFESDNNFKALKLACGDSKTNMQIHQNESTASSSLLKMSEKHTSNFTHAVKTSVAEIEIDTLDNIFNSINLNHPILLKMDVQGFEDKVIEGGKSIIGNADMVITELSFTELYNGQPLFNHLYSMFMKLGFVYSGSIDQLRSPINNKVLQQDGVFIKNDRQK